MKKRKKRVAKKKYRPRGARWSAEARERHARLFDALRFRRLTRGDLGRLGEFDSTATVGRWIERGDPKGTTDGPVLSTARLAAVLRIDPSYLQLGGPDLWQHSVDSEFVSGPVTEREVAS